MPKSYWFAIEVPVAPTPEDIKECQTIDADCNDCKHFKRGQMVPKVVSQLTTKDGRIETTTFQPQVCLGHCMKFDRPTKACPNKWSGYECFEHRKS